METMHEYERLGQVESSFAQLKDVIPGGLAAPVEDRGGADGPTGGIRDCGGCLQTGCDERL